MLKTKECGGETVLSGHLAEGLRRRLVLWESLPTMVRQVHVSVVEEEDFTLYGYGRRNTRVHADAYGGSIKG